MELHIEQKPFEEAIMEETFHASSYYYAEVEAAVKEDGIGDRKHMNLRVQAYKSNSY